MQRGAIMKGFKNAKVYLHGKGIVKLDVKVENGIIAGIGSFDIDEPYYCPDNAVVLPGFIDQHVHGAGGSDAMDGTICDLETISKTLAKEGTTSFLATTMTQKKENILSALSAVKEYRESGKIVGAKLVGVHLEGPFIAEKFKGAQPLEYIVKPSVEVFDEYYKASGNCIKVVTMSPENDENHALIKHLNSLGVIASVGHSNAKFKDVEDATLSGLKGVTHTFNAQSPLHHRDVGTVGSALLLDDLTAEMICDLIHLSAPAIKLLVKNKPPDKIVAITDAMRAKGLEDGVSELGGQKVIVKDGTARLEDGTLAGSILKMNDAIKNLVLSCGVKFTDAVDFATINPAKNLCINNVCGSIDVGKNADFCVMDEDFNVVSTIVNGEKVF